MVGLSTIATFDPGLSGAVATFSVGSTSNVDPEAQDWRVDDLPIMGADKQVVLNGAALAALLRARGVSHAIIERVHAMPGQGVSGMFRFGTAYGQILGVVQALGISYALVSPAKWKREMRLPGGPGKGEASRLRALELLPHMEARLTRKKDHNRAEALLLGLWWQEGKNARPNERR